MKGRPRKFLLSMLIAVSALAPLSAGPSFDVLHEHYRTALREGEIIRAISLYKPISMRLHQLLHDVIEAQQNGDDETAEKYLATLDEYQKYLVTAEEADRMGILKANERHPEKLMEASIFLYENTDFFRPTITIKDELATGSQVHVWMAKPGTDITFNHEYDKSQLDGRVFTGYRRASDGAFKKGEFPTFPMSYDSEVWNAIYEYGCVYRDQDFGYEIFYPVNDEGMVRIPMLSWIPLKYKLGGWRDVDTGKIVAKKDDRFVKFEGRSMTLEPIWESITFGQLHLGNSRKNMKHGSKDYYYLDLTNTSKCDISVLVQISAEPGNTITERVFEFLDLKEGESRTLGPYSIEAFTGSEKEEAYFNIRVKSIESDNEWTFRSNLSIR